MKFQICDRQTALTSIQFTKKKLWIIIQQQVYKKKGRAWMIWCSVWLLTMALTSGADVSMPAFEDILNIDRGIK